MARTAALVYGVVSYLVFFATFLYAIGFVGGLVVPKTIDTGVADPLGKAIAIDAALLGLFAIHHSVLARRGVKAAFTRVVPQPIERSTYVLASSLLLALLFWQWRPIPGVVWSVTGPAAAAITAVFWAGWAVVLVSTFLIDHFDLFGLRQVWLCFRGRDYTPVPFRVTALYRLVRHPLLLGFMIAFWATPRMTGGHLLFAVANTAYVLVAIQLEERELSRFHGEPYDAYRRQVPMLLPLPRSRRA